MLVKYTYDDKTEESIRRFKSYLSQYEELLRAKYKKQRLEGDGATESFFHDAGRNSILEQITKIQSLAIPVAIEFTGV